MLVSCVVMMWTDYSHIGQLVLTYYMMVLRCVIIVIWQ